MKRAHGGSDVSDLKKVKKVKKEIINDNTETENASRGKVNKKGKKLNERLKGFSKIENRRGFKKPTGFKEKIDWTEYKENKKKNRLKKLQTNSHYEMMFQAKKIWEEIRRRKLLKDKRTELVDKVHELLKGKLDKVIHYHDMARIIQCILKYGSPKVCDDICQELLPRVVPIVKSKYAWFCIKPLLLNSNSENRQKIVDAMCGHVVELLTHSVGTRSLELAYSTYATHSQKLKMRQELYGKLAKLEKEDKASCLSELFEQFPTLKPAILSTTKAILFKALNKTHIMVSSLIHPVLLDYFNHCDENEKSELMFELSECVMQLLTSKDGTIMAMNLIWNGTNKLKKTVVKTLKGHVKEISELEHGHLLLLAIFDAVDDTVLVKKALIPELLENAKEMTSDKTGRRILLHLVAPWNKAFFHPSAIKLLQEGCQNSTSKKDPDVKHKELLAEVIGPLLNLVANDPTNFLSNPSMGMLTFAIMKAGKGDELKAAQTAIVSHIVRKENIKVIQDPGINGVLKKLIQNDKENVASGNSTFSSFLVNSLSESTLKKWIKMDRACFLLTKLLESSEEETVNELREKMNETLLELIADETSAGAKLLLTKLKENCE